MAITHTFKGNKDKDRYGYYAYIKNGQLVIGEDWPHEGGDLYVGTFANAGQYIMLLKKEDPKLYNNIIDYYSKNLEQPIEKYPIRDAWEEYYRALEAIRQSGVCNMWGAGVYLKEFFPDLSLADANGILMNWIKNYNKLNQKYGWGDYN